MKINGIGPKAVSSLSDILGGYDTVDVEDENKTISLQSTVTVTDNNNNNNIVKNSNSSASKMWKKIVKDLLNEVVIVPYSSNVNVDVNPSPPKSKSTLKVASSDDEISTATTTATADNGNVVISDIGNDIDAPQSSNITLQGKSVVVSGSFEMHTMSDKRVLSREEVIFVCSKLGTNALSYEYNPMSGYRIYYLIYTCRCT